MRAATPQHGRGSVAWGSWGDAKREARSQQRLRRETIRRIEALEDRRLLAATVSVDASSVLTFNGDLVAAEVVTVSQTGTVYRFTSTNNINIGVNTPGVPISHPSGNAKIVDVQSISGIRLVMHTELSTAGVMSTSVPTTFETQAGSQRSGLIVGAAGDLSGIAAPITIVNSGAVADVSADLNGSAGTKEGIWTVHADSVTRVSGFGSDGAQLVYTPSELGRVVIRNAAGLSNKLTVNFDSGSPLPVERLTYLGGWTNGSPNTSDLVLVGDPSTLFGSETFTPLFVDAGAMTFDELGIEGDQRILDFTGVSPHSLYDTVVLPNYLFNDVNSSASGVLVSAGDNSADTGFVQTLKISSLAGTPLFVDTHIANKTNIDIDQNFSATPYSITVDYSLTTPVAGLELLTITQGDSNDSATLTNLPPGATTSLIQGLGNDTASLALAGTAGTVATTLDGGPGFDVLTIDAGGLAISTANFLLNPGGSVSIQGVVLPGGVITYSNYESVIVNNVAAASLEVTADPIQAVQGVRLTDALVGTFTTTSTTATASNFGATIDWGDGSTSAGTIVQDASDPSVFYVYGTHTYTGPDSPLPTTLTVGALSTSSTVLIGTSQVTFNSPFVSATDEGEATITATVLEPLLPTVSAIPINGIQGVPLTNVLVGSFTSSAPATAADFVASVAWGDGTTTTGTIIQDASDPSIYYIYGSHTYLNPGPALTTTITVRSLANTFQQLVDGSLVTFFRPAGEAVAADGEATITATALDALVPTVYGVPVHGAEGQALTNVLVGAFTSSEAATAADFVATIGWGDGSTSAGTIVQDATNPSVYYIHGSHTYYNPGQGLTTTITVRSLANTFQQLVDGSPVTFFRPAGAPVSLSSQAFIDDAAIDVAVNAISGFENIPIASADLIVATFTDLGGIDPLEVNPVAGYTATIYWGDGSAGVVGTIQRIGTTSRFTVTVAPHTYAAPGLYPVTVVVAQAGEPTLGIGSLFASIDDAPLNQTASQPSLANATEGVRIVDLQVSSFVDANPLATTNEYTVLIDWGDGTGTQMGRIVQPGGVGTTFYVVGSHTYASSIPAGGVPTIFGPGAGPYAALSPNGNYAITVDVLKDGGPALSLFNTITVLDRALTVSGALTSASDTGISQTDGVTKDSTPTFTGVTSEGNATVWVYASFNGGTATAIGSTTSDASGAWTFTPAAALVDGGYTIQAQAYDAGGHTISAAATVASGLVIDTVGPKITDVIFDNIRGRVITSFQDYGGVSNVGVGLASSTIRDANNYRFVKSSQPLRRWLANSITVSPDTTTGEQVATVVFNGGQGIRGGRYAYRVLSVDPSNLSGVQDIAGNALDGEFYGYFPSGNNVNGGDFAAYLDAIHRTIYPASSQVGTATPVSPPGTAATGRTIGRGGVLLPSATSAVRLSAASRTLTAARAARLAALAN